MNCELAQEQLSAALDGELGAEDRDALDRHLAGCADCRSAMSALHALDVQLRRGTVAPRQRATQIAAAVTAQVTARASRPDLRRRLRTPLVVLVSMACGFLLALLLFGTQRGEQAPELANHAPATNDVQPPAKPAAHAIIRAATGPLEVATASPPDWTTLTEPAGFLCPPGAAVRTPRTTVCELETSAGCTVRMNVETELTFLDADDVQIAQGEIWCRTPDAAALKVTPAIREPAAEVPVALVLGPRSASCSLTCESPVAAARVCVASGRIEAVSPNRSEVITAGQSVEFRDGVFEPVTDVRATTTRWMHPLLVGKGFADDELAEHVHALLAGLGRTKLSYLRERDLRSLGEYGALPLLRFLQAPAGADDAERRQTAADILADVTPAWMIPELIELLADADPAIRVSVATALQRLTGETLGMEPEMWAETDRDVRPGINSWRTWWASEREAYPPPPPGVRL